MNREQLRSAAMGTPVSTQTLDIDGVIYEVRGPSIQGRDRIFKVGGMSFAGEGKGEFANLGAAQVEAAILCVFVPGTNERLFQDSDREFLLNQPSNDRLISEAFTLVAQMMAPNKSTSQDPTEGS